jgi:hypothetical protein
MILDRTFVLADSEFIGYPFDMMVKYFESQSFELPLRDLFACYQRRLT